MSRRTMHKGARGFSKHYDLSHAEVLCTPIMQPTGRVTHRWDKVTCHACVDKQRADDADEEVWRAADEGRWVRDQLGVLAPADAPAAVLKGVAATGCVGMAVLGVESALIIGEEREVEASASRVEVLL